MRLIRGTILIVSIVAGFVPGIHSLGLPPSRRGGIETRETHVAKGRAVFACQAVDAFLGGDKTVDSSDGPAYTELENENYSAACWLPAACIVSPSTAREVSKVIRILNLFDVSFAVRSGGHNYSPGFASIGSSGVLISLSNLNHISVADDKTTVSIGPGNRWDAVYNVLAADSLVATGGRVGVVGVGGFILGGGISYFLSEYGLAIDNVESFQVVLGNGRIVTASAAQNPDLYQGLRGGGVNFGIVTSYELYTHPLGEIYFEARAYAPNQTDEFLHAFAAYQETGQLDTLSSITVQMQENASYALLQYSKPTTHPPVFDAFYNISEFTQFYPPTNGTFSDLMAVANAAFSSDATVRMYGETFSHKVDADFMVEAHDIFARETAQLPAGVSSIWVPTAIPANVAEHGQQRGGNLLGVEEVAQQWHEWFFLWDDSNQDEQIHELSRTITAKLTAAAKTRGVLLPYLFMNTAGTNQDVLGSFGEENVKTIKKVARKYDPERVFQRLQNDGYLVRDIK